MTVKTLALTAAALAGTVLAAVPAGAVVVHLSATDFSASTATVTLAAGTYWANSFRGLYTAWAPATPAAGNWTGYYRYTIDGTSFDYRPLNDANGRPLRFATADEAHDAYRAPFPATFSLATAKAVTFSIPDSQGSFGDNMGGLSLNISAVPEPATWGMLVLGFFTAGLAVRSSRRRRPQTVDA